MKNSKHEQIKKHLLKGKSITGLQAMNLYEVYRLSSVINRLRNNENMNITTVMITGENGKTTFARYFLEK